MSPRLRFLTAILIATPTIASCKGSTEVCTGALCDDSGTVTFPAVSSSQLALYCVRGEAVPPTSRTGSISATDCQDGPGLSYYEAYRVRVATGATVAFRMSSTFDSYLVLLRIDQLDDFSGSAVFLGEDDDSAGNLDALLSFRLDPNVEYLIIVAGLDDLETGTYTLTISA